MKRLGNPLKRILALLLCAAAAFTSLPHTAAYSLAAETEEQTYEEASEQESEAVQTDTGQEQTGQEETTGVEHDVTVARLPDHAQVIFTQGSVTDGKAAQGADITFEVLTSAGFEVTEAAYQIGGGQAAELTQEQDGGYRIPGNEVVDSVTIYITTQRTEYTVLFVGEGAAAQVNGEAAASVQVSCGVSLTFRAIPDNPDHKLRYVSTTQSAEGMLPAGEDGSYTFTPGEENTIDGTARIYLSATARKTVPVILIKGQDTTVYRVADGALSSPMGAVNMLKEDDELLICPQAGGMQKVSKVVTGAGGELEAREMTLADNSTVTVYAAVVPDQSFTLEVITQLDEEKANVLMFEGNRSFTVTMDAGQGPAQYGPGDKVVTERDTLSFSIETEPNYHVEKLWAGYTQDGAPAETELPADGGSFQITFSEMGRAVTVSADIRIDPIAQGNTVLFHNTAGHMSLEVDTDEFVTKAEDKKNLYYLAEGARYLSFTVTAAGHYVPLVSLNGRMLEGTPAGAGEIHYSVPAVELADEEVITISEEAEKKKITVIYDAGQVELSARLGGKQLRETEKTVVEQGTQAVYEAAVDSTVIFTAAARENCVLTGVRTESGQGQEKEEKYKPSGCEFTVKASDDMKAVILSKGLYRAELRKEDGEAVPPESGLYRVHYDSVYITQALYGADVPVVLSKAEILDARGQRAASEAITEENGTKCSVIISKKDAGKKLTVNLFELSGGGEEKVIAYALYVLPELKSAAFKGVKNSRISQPFDTRAEYEITSNPKDCGLGALVTPADQGVRAEVNGRKLILTAAPGKGEKTAVVQLFRRDREPSDEDYYIPGGKLDVTLKEPAALLNSTPGVKLKEADDVSLTLALSSPKNLIPPLEGKLYYKIEVIPEDDGNREKPDTIRPQTLYRERTAPSQNEKIVVNTADFGKGCAWKYRIKVTLLQTGGDEPGNALYGSRTGEMKNAASKAPYYETSLSLKRAASTVYTGQSGVAVAIPQFGKNTTFRGVVNAQDVTKGLADSDRLAVKVNEEGRVTVDVPKFYPGVLGKHTIEVTAQAPDNTYEARAKIVVTVVKGIETIYVSLPTDTVYKPENKSGSAKAALVYNGGDKKNAPKTKKVKYEIVKPDGAGFSASDRLYGMVTVKNGAITVNKKYVLSQDEKENQFKLKVTAQDYDGSAAVGLSKVITVTDRAVTPGGICLAQISGDGTGYDVIARSGATLTADGIKGALLLVFREGTPEKDRYSWADYEKYALPLSCLTVRSSNSALKLDAMGYLTLSRPVKNVKITVTANDGGKQKLALEKLTIGYNKPEQLGLRVERRSGFGQTKDSAYIPLGPDDEKELHFIGTQDTVLKLTVVQKETSGAEWKEIDSVTNFKLSVKGAKLLPKTSAYGQEYLISANQQKAAVTLENRETGERTHYTVINGGADLEKMTAAVYSGRLTAGRQNGFQDLIIRFGGVFDYTDKYAMIRTDSSEYEKNSASKSRYDVFEANCRDINSPLPVQADGSVTLRFNKNASSPGQLAQTDIQAGNYKLNITFGKLEEGEFIPETRTVSVTLKAVMPKQAKGSYKPASAVKMSLRDQPQVLLRGTGKAYTQEFYYGLQNANLDGNANRFTEFFEMKAMRIQLKEGLSEEQIAYITGKGGKKDRIGYVNYSVDVGEGVYQAAVSGTARITVSFAEKAKQYKITGAAASAGPPALAELTVSSGGELTAVAGAYVSEGPFEVAGISGAKITLSAAEARKKNKVVLYFVPASSYYAQLVETLGKAEDKEEYYRAVKTYGIKATVTISVKEK